MERRTKASGLRKGPHLNSWIWCVFIKVFCLPCIFSECAGANLSLAVYPKGDIRIWFGNSLELLCIAEDGYVADDLEFHLGSMTLPTEKVNETAIRYYNESLGISLNTFFCRNKKTGQHCTSRVVVDTLPSNVEHFQCLSKNLDQLNCTWDGPQTQHVINYTLAFVVNSNFIKPCMTMKTWCAFYSDKGSPLYRQQLERYDFKLRSCNAFGCTSQNFSIDHFSIVKPDKPTKLEALHIGPHSVNLKWSIPNNIVDLLQGGVEHRIEYQIAEIDDDSHFRKVDATDLPAKNRTYKFELHLPYAYKQYEVRVYIRPRKARGEEFWSDYAFTIINTTSERPQRAPDIAAGSFQQMAYDSYRIINVYWSQLWEFEEAGANFTYKVVVLQGNKTETLFPENKSLSYIRLVNASSDALQVLVWSQNAVGTSDKSSLLYIPSKVDTESLTLKSFTKLSHENGTYELSWNKIDNIDNYTLFWCDLKTFKTCTGHMNFITLPSNVSKHSIDFQRANAYQFAISANSGTKSSGMTWANCDIPRGQVALLPFPMTLSHGGEGATFVTLKWDIECKFPDGYLKGYVINYCPVIDTTTICHSNKNQSITIHDPTQKSVKIENLLPYRTYQFTIAVINSIGTIKQNITDTVTTFEDTPSQPVNVRIDNITDDSLNISWEPPLHKNGKISNYNVIMWFSNGLNQSFDVDGTVTHRQITGLQESSNYTFAVRACNFNANEKCSRLSLKDKIFVRTRFGPPGKISTPSYNNTMGTIEWVPPGRVELYQVKILRDGREEEAEVFNTTNLAINIKRCEGTVEVYQVRGINFDSELHHGAQGDPDHVILPVRLKDGEDELVGNWSEKYTMPCGQPGGWTLVLIIVAVFTVVAVAYGSLKLYKKLKQMEDIKPVFPNGLSVPEKDLTKYGFGGWNQINKDEKPSSDEMLLLPNSKSTVSPVSPGIKQSNIDKCDASDHTDSTGLSNNSQGPMDRQSSVSDNGSESSLHLELEQVVSDENSIQKDEEASTSELESSRENSPYLNDPAFKKNPVSGYVQSVLNPAAIQAEPSPLKSPLHQTKLAAPPAGTSYVMAGLSPSIFTTGLTPPSVSSQLPASGYVRAEDAQARSMNFPKLGPSPTKLFGPESLPTMTNTAPPSKLGVDNSYIQLQSLGSLPNLKGCARAASEAPRPAGGYVSPEDAVISKHLSHMMAARAPDPPAMVDPAMSPDAYCRFSWSTDPAIDNFNSLLVDSSALNSPKN